MGETVKIDRIHNNDSTDCAGLQFIILVYIKSYLNKATKNIEKQNSNNKMNSFLDYSKFWIEQSNDIESFTKEDMRWDIGWKIIQMNNYCLVFGTHDIITENLDIMAEPVI